jgi:hypothetical protein
VKTRGYYFLLAGGSAIIALLTLADYGDGARDRLFVVLGTLGAVLFLIRGLRAGRSKTGRH